MSDILTHMDKLNALDSWNSRTLMQGWRGILFIIQRREGWEPAKNEL